MHDSHFELAATWFQQDVGDGHLADLDERFLYLVGNCRASTALCEAETLSLGSWEVLDDRTTGQQTGACCGGNAGNPRAWPPRALVLARKL